MKVGSVGAQQRWCFVDGCEFQPTNIFWMTDDASPLGQLNITLTCPDADKMMSRFQKVLEVRMPKTTNACFQSVSLKSGFNTSRGKTMFFFNNANSTDKSKPLCKTCNDKLGHPIS